MFEYLFWSSLAIWPRFHCLEPIKIFLVKSCSLLNLAGSLFQCSLKKATRNLFGSCPLLVVYHSDVSIKTLSDCLSLLYCYFPEKTCFTCASSSSNLMCNRLAIDRPCPEDKQLCRLVKRVSHQNMFFGGTPYWSNTKTVLHIKMKTRFHQRWPFQNRAQDEHHKCHTFGEIYFHWKFDNFQDI